MLNILPFEIISRNTKTLLITYISSVDISHEGMKKILESLHTQRGIIPESYLDELLDYEAIDKDKGALLMEWSPPISCATVGR